MIIEFVCKFVYREEILKRKNQKTFAEFREILLSPFDFASGIQIIGKLVCNMR